jgi:hypothetical protein
MLVLSSGEVDAVISRNKEFVSWTISGKLNSARKRLTFGPSCMRYTIFWNRIPRSVACEPLHARKDKNAAANAAEVMARTVQ